MEVLGLLEAFEVAVALALGFGVEGAEGEAETDAVAVADGIVETVGTGDALTLMLAVALGATVAAALVVCP